MVLKKLKPGMTVYRVKRSTGLRVFNGKWNKTDCYCSECGNYLGSKDFTHPAAIGREFTDDINFCQYCGAALYEQD